jgi:hypothetical protein
MRCVILLADAFQRGMLAVLLAAAATFNGEVIEGVAAGNVQAHKGRHVKIAGDA